MGLRGLFVGRQDVSYLSAAPMGLQSILLASRVASTCLHILAFSLRNSCIIWSSLWLKLQRKAQCFGVGF